MTKEEFIKALEDLKIKYTSDMLEQLEIYKEYLKEYNTHTNLTRIIDDNDIYLKHFYDSLTIVKCIDLNNIDNLLDIGSGAGFPGVVLKIFYPHLNITLIDANNKKTKFLESLAHKLNINVEVINQRVEDYAKDNLNKFALVTGRAVANMRVLSELSLPLVKKDGLFVALKGNIENELNESLDTIEILNSKIENIITFELNNNAGLRNIVVIKKIEETTKNNLRTYDKILKKPLVKKR